MSKKVHCVLGFLSLINIANGAGFSSGYTQDQYSSVYTSTIDLYCQNGRAPTAQQVARDTGYNIDQVRVMMTAHQLEHHALANAYGTPNSNSGAAIASVNANAGSTEGYLATHGHLFNAAGNNAKHKH